MADSAWFVLAIVLVALAFDFVNGFHDAANSIATVVSTRVLSPSAAVVWAATFNFIAVFVFGTAVAKTMGKGLVDLAIVDATVILAGLVGAIVWDLITWWLGLPTSSSHALIGGYGGAAVAKAGVAALLFPGKWIATLVFIVVAPVSATVRPGPVTVTTANVCAGHAETKMRVFPAPSAVTTPVGLTEATSGELGEKPAG